MLVKYNGENKEYDSNINMFEIAKGISNSLAKKSVGAKVDGKNVDMSYVLDHDAEVEFIDIDSPEGEDIVRHSTAHLMAQAVLRLYPETKVTIGPVIENGFYYDFDPVEQFTEEDLEKIEAEMKRIVKENIKLEKYVLPRDEAIDYFRDVDKNKYKVEIVEGIPQGEQVSFYKQGDFTDLCRGTHVPSTGYLKAKLENSTTPPDSSFANSLSLDRVSAAPCTSYSLVGFVTVTLSRLSQLTIVTFGEELVPF